jgi:hypothetical protein
MERLFSPCTRLHDMLESQGRLQEFRDHREGLQELNLDVSTDEFLSAERAFTYADLYAMLEDGDMVAWLTPHTAVARDGRKVLNSWEELEEACCLSFSADDDDTDLIAFASSPEHLLEICDVVLRLLAASVVHSVMLHEYASLDGELINAPTLAYLMDRCQSLKALKLEGMPLQEDHIRVLGAYSRPELDIVLENCKLTSDGSSALVEILGRNQGPTKLDSCYMDNFVLSNGLRGNSHLKSLTPRLSSNLELGSRELLAIAPALKENKGLVDLNFSHCSMSNETWGTVCYSLKAHPTLQVLHLRSMRTFGKTRTQALVEMLKVNVSMHTIDMTVSYSEHALFRGSIMPYLKTNRLRPRVRAIQKTRPIMYRAKVLGEALLAVRTDANRFWMLLSGNPEVAFPSTTATTTPAANLPTPATVGASGNASTSANAATGAANPIAIGPPTVKDAASTSGQKRKACP